MTTTDTPQAPAPASGWPRVVGTIAGMLLGAVFLFSAYAKAIDPVLFQELIEKKELDVLLPTHVVALAAFAVLMLLGLLLFFGARRLWVLIPSTLLVAFFIYLAARGWYMDAHGLAEPHEGCGCFGSLIERTPQEAFWQDLLSLLPAALLAWLGRPKGPPQPWNRLGLAGATTVAGVVFSLMAPDMPVLDDLATRLSPGTHVDSWCVGEGSDEACIAGKRGILPELSEGRHYVVLTDLHESAFLDAIPRLNEQIDRDDAKVQVLTSRKKDEHIHLEFQYGATFSPTIVPPALLRPLYRSLPRSFLVENGVVKETWPGLPPLPPAGQ